MEDKATPRPWVALKASGMRIGQTVMPGGRIIEIMAPHQSGLITLSVPSTPTTHHRMLAVAANFVSDKCKDPALAAILCEALRAVDEAEKGESR